MNVTEKIKAFHSHLNYNAGLTTKLLVKKHRIQFLEGDQCQKNCLKVRAFHFTVLSSERAVFSTAMVVNSKVEWQKIEQESFYYEKELTDFALQCLYLSAIPLGECIVKRVRKKEVAVVEIRQLEAEELSRTEKELVELQLKKHYTNKKVTFGTDLELMLLNKKTKKFLNVDITVKDSQFGFDDCIALNNHRVFHPIFEVRPNPATTMEQLQQHLLPLYWKIVKQAGKHQLEVITEPNPLGRFYLGGHIHFGNVPLTFKHVYVLDQFLAIPFSLIEQCPSYERRRQYGKLGSVRSNQYQGFEYRVLPTWFQFIPEMLPILNWVEFIIENAEILPTPKLNKKYIENYYDRLDAPPTIQQWSEENISYFMKKDVETLFKDFVECLKKLA